MGDENLRKEPSSAMCRYELLRNLREEGINEIEAIRADERRWPERYPVFLRHEQDHGRPLSAELLKSHGEWAVALEKARMDGMSLRGLLILEYAAEAFDGPWFRKFNTFRVGSEVFAHQVVVEGSWVVKYGKEGVKFPEEYKVYEQDFVKGNWHADVMRRVFEIAGIEYGRADWGIVRGKVQVYEINTNPFVSGDAGSTNPTRKATIAMSTKKLCESLAALGSGTKKGTVKMEAKLLEEWRKGKKWYERAERMPYRGRSRQ